MHPQILPALDRGARIVTATRRLSYEVKASYDAHQIAQHKEVWPTPVILSWDGWMQTLWQHHRIHSTQICLNNAQLQQLLIEIIQADLENNPSRTDTELAPLWNVPATAKTALRAWQLCHEWRIAYTPLQQCGHIDHAHFGRWATQLYARLQEKNWISQAQIPDYLIAVDALLKDETLLLGFDRLNTQQQSFIDRHQSRGATIRTIRSHPVARQKVNRYVFENTLTEWQHIGAWARHCLQLNPLLKIAIVCPDTENIRQLATQALHEQLTPAYFEQAIPEPFHFSRGSALADIPLVRDALNCLSLLTEIEFTHLSPIFLSRYWGSEREQLLRAQLLLDLRSHIAYQFDLFQLIRALCSDKIKLRETSDGAKLLDKLAALQDLKATHRGEHPLSEWRALFKQALQLLNWPVAKLDSSEFQAWEAWEHCLDDWIQLDVVCAQMNLSQALQSLRIHCEQIQFQAQAQTNAPIQIMGILEAAELDFDALWLAGFNEQAWPATASPHPFIPVKTQIKAGLPEASLERQREQAHSHLTQLLTKCEQTHISHACIVEDIELDISPMLASTKCVSSETLARPFSLYEAIREATPELEQHIDDTGLHYDSQTAHGGTGLIQKQSACPFAAYTQYRLNIRQQDEPEAGMDNLNRGNLLHDILASIWKELKNSSMLIQHNQKNTLQALVARHTADHLPRHARHSGLGEGFMQAEIRRLTALINEWLTLEAQRPAFEVIASEQKIEHCISGLKLNFFLDRVDHVLARQNPSRLEQGQKEQVQKKRALDNVTRLIIDYKSGSCELRSWAGDRPEQPQMPLYYLALNHQSESPPIEALAFAQVKQEDCRFVGLSRTEDSLPDVRSLEELPGNTVLKKELEDWSQLKPVWQARMDALVAEFKAGVANVDPKSKASCNYCDFAALCRIESIAQQETEDEPG